MFSYNELLEIVDSVEFRDWSPKLSNTVAGPYFQWSWETKDSYSGKPTIVHSRKWIVSFRMTKSEVVQTMLKAALTSVEHEARENFRYKGKVIFGPHFNVDSLWEMSAKAEHLDMRTGAWVDQISDGSGSSGRLDSGPIHPTVHGSESTSAHSKSYGGCEAIDSKPLPPPPPVVLEPGVIETYHEGSTLRWLWRKLCRNI